MRGYWKNEKATEENIDGEGWFHTGDLGEIDDEGYLKITGRKKEILVTAGGKNVAPAVLEDRLRSHALVSQCIVVGDVARRSRQDDLIVGQLDVLPDDPLVLVADIPGLERIRAGVDGEHHVDNVAHRDVGGVRAVPAAPAQVEADASCGKPRAHGSAPRPRTIVNRW